MRQLLAISAVLLTAAPAIAEIKYQDSGRPWTDVGFSYVNQPEASRLLLQVWKILPNHKQVIYWTRQTFSKDYAEKKKREHPNLNVIADLQLPMGPYLVDCTTKAVSLVLMEQGWTAPVFRPVGEDFPWANTACRLSGITSPE